MSMQKTDLQFVTDVVRAAATLMDRTGGFEVRDKGARENIVTSSDLAVQHWLTEQLRLRFPDIGFLCEEEDFSDIQGHEAVWVIDPIDGTANYARGNENCCISVALVKSGEPVLGVVYSPWRDELYTAEKGKGALLNGKPIHVSARPFEEGILFTALAVYRKDLSLTCSAIIHDLYMECNDIRRNGSAALELCHLASGFAELYFEIRLMPWDYAAAGLILTEAGGTLLSFDGNGPSPFKPSLVIGANCHASARRVLDTVRKHLPALPY
ncbi:MAG TPA: inositol monophosphatase [Rikenellaceae bacterium]|nr:inositol monophosphatase [Rikenellaceae bacterium]